MFLILLNSTFFTFLVVSLFELSQTITNPFAKHFIGFASFLVMTFFIMKSLNFIYQNKLLSKALNGDEEAFKEFYIRKEKFYSFNEDLGRSLNGSAISALMYVSAVSSDQISGTFGSLLLQIFYFGVLFFFFFSFIWSRKNIKIKEHRLLHINNPTNVDI